MQNFASREKITVLIWEILMKPFYKFLSVVCLSFISLSICSYAEEVQEQKLETRTFQLSFITPLGSNGWDSWSIINKFSLNVLTGYAGGVHGAELSGLVSVLRADMRGAQLSGIGNIVLNRAHGSQFAGVTNIVMADMKGAQLSGVGNIVLGKARGAQFAGVTNIAQGLNGSQFAGVANISAGVVKGSQVAAVFNYAKTLRGLQLGVFNYADSVESGVPVGILSIVKDGYRAWELGANESIYGTTSFKVGVRKFYSIFSVGGGHRKERALFAWGFGFGGLIPLIDELDIAIEGQGFHVNEGEWFTDGTNALGRVSASISWSVAKHLTLFAGPTWNVAVSNIKKENGSAIAPWSVFDKTTEGGVNIKMYPGLMAGIRI